MAPRINARADSTSFFSPASILALLLLAACQESPQNRTAATTRPTSSTSAKPLAPRFPPGFIPASAVPRDQLPKLEDAITTIRSPQLADETVRTKSGASFTAPKGFSVVLEPPAAYLRGPRREVSLTFVEVSPHPDAGAAAAAAMQQVNPTFGRDVKRITELPARDGWDAAAKIDYMPDPNRPVDTWAIARRKGKQWYVAQFHGFREAWERWWPAVHYAYASYHVPGVEEESFQSKTARVLDASRLRSLDAFAQKAITMMKIPGAAIAVVQGGKIVFEKGYGVRELGSKDPVTPATLFRIASLTKPMTSAMVAALVDEGTFAWDTPITRLWPNFRAHNPALTQKINVWHTLCGCTGLPRRDVDYIFEYSGKTPDFLFERLKHIEPTTGFEETFQYSSQMYAAGGYIAAHAAYPSASLSSAYPQAMKAKVFDPLGMNSTTFDSESAKRTEHAGGHAYAPDYQPVPLAPSEDDIMDSYLAPAGGAWSTIRDLSAFLLTELSKGKSTEGKQLFSEENFGKRLKGQIHSGDREDYGLGIYIGERHGVRFAWADGGLLGYSSTMFFLPDHGVGAVILSNLGVAHAWQSAFERKWLELLFDGRKEADEDLKFAVKRHEASYREPAERYELHPGTEWLEPLVGTYTNETLGEVSIRIEGEQGIWDAGEWQSPIGRPKSEEERSLSLVLVAPGRFPMPIQARSKRGKPVLVLEMFQRQYVFEKGI